MPDGKKAVIYLITDGVEPTSEENGRLGRLYRYAADLGYAVMDTCVARLAEGPEPSVVSGQIREWLRGGEIDAILQWNTELERPNTITYNDINEEPDGR